MTTEQQHLVELSFTVFVLNLFKHSNNPVNAMNWLKQTCVILDINQEPMQQMVTANCTVKQAFQMFLDKVGG